MMMRQSPRQLATHLAAWLQFDRLIAVKQHHICSSPARLSAVFFFDRPRERLGSPAIFFSDYPAASGEKIFHTQYSAIRDGGKTTASREFGCSLHDLRSDLGVAIRHVCRANDRAGVEHLLPKGEIRGGFGKSGKAMVVYLTFADPRPTKLRGGLTLPAGVQTLHSDYSRAPTATFAGGQALHPRRKHGELDLFAARLPPRSAGVGGGGTCHLVSVLAIRAPFPKPVGCVWPPPPWLALSLVLLV